ncbi:MAG TPA: helix-turn-helix domain-containing protein [Desulfobacteraceae bacterium]|nr:helix-turn-helix domain-containing protein [Desulfobacteraceae bacterium]
MHDFLDDLDVLLTEKDAAVFLSLSPRWLQKHRLTGDGPQFVRISHRCVRYRKRDLLDWMENRFRRSTAEDAA